jgi:glutaredoxin
MSDYNDLYNPKPSTIVVYSTIWCPDCKRSKAFLDQRQVKYLDVDIGKDNNAFLFLEKLTRRVKVPTIIFPDGAIMVEPSNTDLARKLGIE